MNDGTIGSVALTASLKNVWSEVAIDLAMLSAAALAAFALAQLIARRMQRSLLTALGSLTDTANRIADRLDQILSDGNIARINATLANLEKLSGDLGDDRQGVQALLVSARDAARNLDRTLDTTNGMMQKIDGNVVQKLPPLLDKLDTTLARLDSAAGNADAILGENRAAISSFSNDGLAQLGPTLSELRGLTRDLRQVSDRLQGNPARYLLGRDAPKEFDPK